MQRGTMKTTETKKLIHHVVYLLLKFCIKESIFTKTCFTLRKDAWWAKCKTVRNYLVEY